jgi:transcriptional regulator with XRE-family HTH domain
MYEQWLRNGLKQPGKSNVGLAKALGINPSGVSRMLKGERKLQLSEVEKAAAYLGLPPPTGNSAIVNGPVAPTRQSAQAVVLAKSASAEVWRKAGVKVTYEAIAIPFVPEPSLAGLTQYATRIDGSDFNKVLRPGDYAIFVPFQDVRKSPQDGDIVEVERHRGDLKEVTVRRVRIKGDVVELWPESDDPQWQTPMRYHGQGAPHGPEITGCYVGLFRPAPGFRR